MRSLISPRYAHLFFDFSEYIPIRTKYILVKVLKLQVQTSTYSVGTVPQWYCLRYLTKPLVLVCTSGTYLLVMHVKMQVKATFRFGTRYILICTTLKDVQMLV